MDRTITSFTLQSKPPVFADDQRTKILNLLRAAGPEGVRREDLLFVHRWTQCGTRIHELERMGYQIVHEMKTGQRYVTYRLVSEPLSTRSTDWYVEKFGRQRPQPPTPSLPLFTTSTAGQ